MTNTLKMRVKGQDESYEVWDGGAIDKHTPHVVYNEQDDVWECDNEKVLEFWIHTLELAHTTEIKSNKYEELYGIDAVLKVHAEVYIRYIRMLALDLAQALDLKFSTDKDEETQD